mmetsp:Transcript_50525/g.93988  ORF Transcript_50525/g.93988 Transcript_50525/m.93988 type:complete len:609 (+) Transcript_50525:78-1904(+)
MSLSAESRKNLNSFLSIKESLESRLVKLEAELQKSKQVIKALGAAVKKSLKANVRLVASGGTEFLMDEATLLQVSPYFVGLLGGGFAEQESRVVKFDDIEPAALECVCMAIRCGLHPGVAFESCIPAVLTKALELSSRLQLPDTLIVANVDAIIAKIDNLDLHLALDLLVASELQSEGGPENLNGKWKELKCTTIQAIACRLEEATDAQVASLSVDQLLLVLEKTTDRKLDPVTVACPEVSKEQTTSNMLTLESESGVFRLKVECVTDLLAAFLYPPVADPRAYFVEGTQISLEARPGSSKHTMSKTFPAAKWMDAQGWVLSRFCADSEIKEFLHEDGQLYFSVVIKFSGFERKANLVVKWVGMQESYEDPKTPCHALRWLALTSSSNAIFAERVSSVLIDFTARTFFAQKELAALPAAVFVKVLRSSSLRTSKETTNESEKLVLCAVLDWTLHNGEDILVGADVCMKATGKTAKVIKRPEDKYEVLTEGEEEPVLLEKHEMELASTILPMLLEQVRFPYILLSDLAGTLSAPQWEILNACPKFKELGKQATEFQIKRRSLDSPGSGDIGNRHLKRARQASSIPTLSTDDIFGGLFGKQPEEQPSVPP